MAGIIALISTIFCGLVAVKCAKKFCQTSPRDFSIFSLYALSWVLLLPYYGDNGLQRDPVREMFPAFSAFIVVYIGGVLRRSSHHDARKPEITSGEVCSSQIGYDGSGVDHELTSNLRSIEITSAKAIGPDDVEAVDLWSLNLLAIFLVPELFKNVSFEQPLFDLAKVAMHCFEWYSILYGMRALYMNQSQWLWILVGIPYIVLDLVYGLWQLCIPYDQPMNEFFLVWFAVSKLIYFPAFCWLVLQKNSLAFRSLSTKEKCQSLMPFEFLWKNIMNHTS